VKKYFTSLRIGKNCKRINERSSRVMTSAISSGALIRCGECCAFRVVQERIRSRTLSSQQSDDEESSALSGSDIRRARVPRSFRCSFLEAGTWKPSGLRDLADFFRLRSARLISALARNPQRSVASAKAIKESRAVKNAISGSLKVLPAYPSGPEPKAFLHFAQLRVKHERNIARGDSARS